MKLFVLVAAAAMTLASCQKNEITGPVKKEVNFTIKADMAETKTAITDKGDGTYSPTWKGGDKIAVLFSEPTKDCKKDAEFVNANEDGAKAQFEGKHTFETEEGVEEVEGTLYAFYPSSAFNKGYQDGTVRLDLPAVQNPTSTSFDPACDLLVAKPCYYYAAADGDAYDVLVDDMYFARLISVLRINLNSDFLEDEIVKSVSFDADGLRLTGAMAVDPIEGVLVKNNSTTDLSEVQAMYTETDPIAVSGEKNSAYLVVAPVTIPSGTTLTFTIETENYDIVKTINAPADMEMPAGNIAVINLTIKEENCTAKVEDTSDYSGEWLITGVNEGQVYAAGAYVSGKNNLNVTVPITISGEKINEVDGLAACKMVITKITEGEYVGMYTIQDANELYLYAASSSSNYLRASTTLNANSYWEIAENTDGTYSVVATKSSNHNVMQFNYNNASPIFSCYASDSMSDVTLYPYSCVQPDKTPRIIVAEEALTQNVDADATGLSFNYSLKNISGVPTATVAEGATMTNVSATADNGTVTVTFAANEEESPKTATVTLSYEGAEPVSVTITQAAKAAAGAAYYEKVTSAPAADWSGTYLIVANTNVATAIDGSWLKFASVEINDNKIESTDIIDAYAVMIEKVPSQSYYTIKLANGLYLGTPSSNGIKQSLSAGDEFYWIFSLASGLVKIESNAYSGRILRLNGTSGFRTYTSTTGTQATLYKLVGESGETPVEKTLESIAVSGAKTEYTVDDEFVEPTVTATYSDGSTEDVTASAEFTGYNMSAADTYTVTVSYSGKTTTYSITVSAAQGGGEDGGETTGGYTLVTSLSDITTGQYVIAAKVDGTYYAMSNTFSSKINGTSVTVTDNAISESDAQSYVVSITKDGANYYISSGTNYLKYKSSTDLGTQSDQYSWTIAAGTNGTFRINATTGTNRAIMYQISGERFGGYATTNASGYADIELFKKN